MGKTILLPAIGIFAILAMMMPSMPFASAGDTICAGDLSGIHDNVVVQSGDSCFILAGATINGNVKVESGGDLSASGSTINGNIEADGAISIRISGVTVGGDVQIKKTTGIAVVDSSIIGGNLQMEENSGVSADAFLNTIGGNLQYDKN